jgi:hypothetical protein
MRAIADATPQPESEEIAVANALAVLREKLGWHGDSEARSEVLSHFAEVARAVAGTVSAREFGGPEPDVMTTLAEFEAWYAQNHPGAFWALFEQHFPETPLTVCGLYIGHSLGFEMTMGIRIGIWVRDQSACHQRRNCETLST